MVWVSTHLCPLTLALRVPRCWQSEKGRKDTPAISGCWSLERGAACQSRFLCPRDPGSDPALALPSCVIQALCSVGASVQFSHSVVSDSLWPHEPQHARPPCPSITPKIMSIELVMPPNHLILCRPLLLLPSIFPSIRVFSNESALCIRWQKDWSFMFNISPSNEHSGLISFRMD